MPRKEASLSVITIAIMLVATMMTLTGFGNFPIAQGQGNLTIGNQTLTPEQKAAICDPNNPLSKLDHVNTTESEICGIPKHNATSPEGIAPSVVPPPSPEDTTPPEE
ncbi:MAG: hypothetical protein ACJ71R_22500 [Nitrososphaeraceae archaeon]